MKLMRELFIPLRQINFMDSSLIITGVGEKSGLTALLAKGILRPKSKLRGEIMPFSVSEVLYLNKETREMHPIREAKLLQVYSAVFSNYEKVKELSRVARALLRNMQKGQNTNVFPLLQGYIEAMEASDNICKVTAAFFVKFLSVSGYNPQLYHCVKCGRETDLEYFSPQSGGVVCSDCEPYFKDAIKINTGILMELRKLVSMEYSAIDSLFISDITHDIVNSMLHYHTNMK